MKTRNLLIIIILVTVVMVVIAGGSKKKLSTEEAYEIYAGTWINEEYNKDKKPAKFIIKPDGTYTAYTEVNIDAIPTTGKFTITDSMIDSDGNIWMKVTNTGEENLWKYTFYEIIKIHDNKATMEVASSEKEGWYGKDYPAEIESNTIRYTYFILYRQ